MKGLESILIKQELLKLFDFLHFSPGMMLGAVTVQDSDVITTGPLTQLGGWEQDGGGSKRQKEFFE